MTRRTTSTGSSPSARPARVRPRSERCSPPSTRSTRRACPPSRTSRRSAGWATGSWRRPRAANRTARPRASGPARGAVLRPGALLRPRLRHPRRRGAALQGGARRLGQILLAVRPATGDGPRPVREHPTAGVVLPARRVRGTAAHGHPHQRQRRAERRHVDVRGARGAEPGLERARLRRPRTGAAALRRPGDVHAHLGEGRRSADRLAVPAAGRGHPEDRAHRAEHGGDLVPRAAAFEPRLAAAVAMPGCVEPWRGFPRRSGRSCGRARRRPTTSGTRRSSRTCPEPTRRR